MSNIIEIATQQLLASANIQSTELNQVFDKLLSRRIDMADLYFQSSCSESWSLEAGIVRSGSYNIDRGVGVRAVSGEKTGFAYANEIALPTLSQAAEAARSITQQTTQQVLKVSANSIVKSLYSSQNILTSLSETDKIALLQTINSVARQQDPRVKQVMASLSAEHETILILDTDGNTAADIRPLLHCSVTVIVEDGKGGREQGHAGGGGRYDYRFFVEQNLAEQFAREAVRQALVNLEAIPAPAGMMPVVLGAGWPGVLLHEAIGHGLEGDFNRKGSSAFSGRIGERVASPLCTIVDDGTLANRRGSLNIDDEGTPTQCTMLIEKGILRGYLQDKLNARLMKAAPTGNGRRESYAHIPMPRMTNTYMLAGTDHPADIIASVEKGIYAVNFAGGQVDITSGQFVFSASEAYLIEHGKIVAPVKGATLIGNGPDILNKVTMVGNDLQLDSGIGVCGKEGQSVPVGVGQPTLKISAMTVGGTH